MKYASDGRVKKSRMRTIKQGTVYGISGQLRRMTREIERQEEEGTISDCIVILRRQTKGSGSIESYHWGSGSAERAHWMLSTAKNRVEPA